MKKQKIIPPVFNLIASLWVINPLGVEINIEDDFSDLCKIFKALYVIKNFFDGVDTWRI